MPDMTKAEQRAAIVSALTGISLGTEAITGVPFAPEVAQPLMAWPVWDSTEPVNACAATVTWRVIVALPPSDWKTADAATDEIEEAVMSALYGLGHVTRIEPVTWLGSDTVGIPCVQFMLNV